jgi:ketosteroid isomerase-like protein
MSEANVEAVQRVIAAFNSGGDARLAEELVESDARFEPLLAGVEGGTYEGPTGVMRWVSELHEMFADVHADYAQIEDLGDVVVMSGTPVGRSRASGVPVEQHWFSAVRFREGKISYAAFRPTRAEALEAAGVSE